MLAGANVALGVTGSIAAVRTVELVHELRRRGANVRAVLTGGAQGIVHPWSLQYATGEPVVTELTGAVEHVELCGTDGWADVFAIAPATANTIGKVPAAIDDTPVTTCATTALGADVPVVVAPAMHEPMYDHPGVLDAIARLEEWDVAVVDPRIEEGKAKIATDEAIVTEIARARGNRPLQGAHVVVTAGGTVESVDPVRILTSRSSGQTGRAVARSCYVRGADVTLVHGGVAGMEPGSGGSGSGGSGSGGTLDASVPHADLVTVESAQAMTEAVLDAVEGADALVSAAAISDYTLEGRDEKIASGAEDLRLDLTPTPKLIDRVREADSDLPIVGFKAETGADDETLLERARATLERVDLSFVVANDASVMASDRTRALLVRSDGFVEYQGEKAGLGDRVASELASELS